MDFMRPFRNSVLGTIVSTFSLLVTSLVRDYIKPMIVKLLGYPAILNSPPTAGHTNEVPYAMF